MSEDESNLRLENWKILNSIREKSEDDFEKNIFLITSGTLLLSMTFIEKISPLENAQGVIFLVLSWISLTTSLILNLYSHRVSAKYSSNQLNLYSDGIAENDLRSIIIKENKQISKINNRTVGSMILGIVFLVTYCSINAFQMSNKPVIKPSTPSQNPNSGEKYQGGRHTPNPFIPRPTPPPPPPLPPKKD